MMNELRVSATPPIIIQRDPLRTTWFWRLCRMIARPLVTFLYDLKVHGRQNVPARGGVLLVCNHQSYLDPVLTGVFLNRPMCYVAKSELFEDKWFSWLIRSLNAFPVKQGSRDVGAVKEMLKRLKEGWMLTIYPEGSRTESGEMGAIEPGAALLIRRAGVPAVPVVIEGSYDAWRKGRKRPRRYPIDVMYGTPMELSGLKTEQITQLIDRTLREMLEELRRRRAARRRQRW